ncbi:MAG: hypothetical protein J5623_09975 [Clostridiales bacterium]|jgi:hypothetical protein|nr:hypothetical protein [Clostridiales bacterium]
MLFGNNKDTRRELVGAFEAVEGIRLADNRDEAILFTGFALGVICQKVDNKKLTKKTGDTIARMAEAVGEEVRKKIEKEEKDNMNVIDFDHE